MLEGRLNQYDIALIGLGAIIIGSLLGAWSTYRFSIKLSEWGFRNKANRNFIQLFHSELSEIYPIPANWPDDIATYLDAKFPKLQAAVADFRPELRTTELEGFDTAWFEYYCSATVLGDKSLQRYHHYKDLNIANEDSYEQQNGKDTFKNNIDNILKYVKANEMKKPINLVLVTTVPLAAYAIIDIAANIRGQIFQVLTWALKHFSVVISAC